jgi:serine/threonine-protein kinase RsbW
MEKRFERQFDSLDPMFGFLTEAMSREGANEGVAFSVKLAVEELFTNMVKYNTGSGGEILLRIATRDDTLVVDIIDFDVDPFDPGSAREASVDDPIRQRQIGGLGLRLVRSVVDKITYEYKDRQMTVTLVKTLER